MEEKFEKKVFNFHLSPSPSFPEELLDLVSFISLKTTTKTCLFFSLQSELLVAGVRAASTVALWLSETNQMAL